ncbi:hypothetical protein AEM51_07365 [Bacteroidetes bacterium UKL13-3]|jgi:hypothetical protein|nr:hypothetical protein AEM51_07365 [Bacteroidetes bacterium UKL13-3]
MKLNILALFIVLFVKNVACQSNHCLSIGFNETVSLNRQYSFFNLFNERPSNNLSLFSLGYIFNNNRSFINANINSTLSSEDQYSQNSVNIKYGYSIYNKERNEINLHLIPTIGTGYSSDYVKGKGLNNNFVAISTNMFIYRYGMDAIFVNKNGIFAIVGIYHAYSNVTNWRNTETNKKLDGSYRLNKLEIEFGLGFRFK